MATRANEPGAADGVVNDHVTRAQLGRTIRAMNPGNQAHGGIEVERGCDMWLSKH